VFSRQNNLFICGIPLIQLPRFIFEAFQVEIKRRKPLKKRRKECLKQFKTKSVNDRQSFRNKEISRLHQVLLANSHPLDKRIAECLLLEASKKQHIVKSKAPTETDTIQEKQRWLKAYEIPIQEAEKRIRHIEEDEDIDQDQGEIQEDE